MASYLITGSSRGIGLEMTRQLIGVHENITIFAAARSTTNPEFQDLLRKYPTRLIHVPVDVTSDDSIKKAASLVAAKLDGRGLDILINNAGIISYGRIQDMDDLEETFRTNVSGVHSMIRALLPLMRKGEQKKILNISSSLGSISMQSTNYMTVVPSYKISKAALNMLTVIYAYELKEEGFTVFCVSPGWLKTDMGSENADLPVSTGVASVLKILSETDKKDNGHFFNIEVPGWARYDGKQISW
ncbi:hypothetical protein BDV24DRAFT_154666 [Aspergillus arachidicola]|uniref:Short chain oxidoreductase (CsgA) n=1 Tax=Aspergillus arachidicola TaxID=656916 RepID=A0A5N6XVD1_9EURO|nr:hypothetical protein BDV24DRAFT_154666 [Aspergillus arachidicola]